MIRAAVAAVALAADIALAAWLIPATPAAADNPPECRAVVMVYNSGAGPVVRSVWCGTGAGGEPPVQEGRGALRVIVDGGPFGNGAVILWPASPAS